mmetsp:Transcript_9405/g.21189  ORF Transcript_9405/g.21189 Transcript_9405/m.21189 type:complete len:541 (+) Transcript_9405:444-2066(+)
MLNRNRATCTTFWASLAAPVHRKSNGLTEKRLFNLIPTRIRTRIPSWRQWSFTASCKPLRCFRIHSRAACTIARGKHPINKNNSDNNNSRRSGGNNNNNNNNINNNKASPTRGASAAASSSLTSSSNNLRHQRGLHYHRPPSHHPPPPSSAAASSRQLSTTTTTTTTPVSVYEWVHTMLHDAPRLDEFVQILKTANDYAAFFWETKGVAPRTARTVAFEFVLVDAPKLDAFVRAQATMSTEITSSNSGGGGAPVEAGVSVTPFDDQFRSDACRQQQKDRERYDEREKTSTSLSLACVFVNLGGDAILVAPRPYFNHPQPTTTTSSEKEPQQQLASKQQQPPPPQPHNNHNNNKGMIQMIMGNRSPSSSKALTYGHLANFVRYAPQQQVHEYWVLVLQTYLERLSGSDDGNNNEDAAGAASMASKNNNNATVSSDATGVSSSQQPYQPPPLPATKILSQLTLEPQQPRDKTTRTKNSDGGSSSSSPNNNNNKKSTLATSWAAADPVWLSTSGMGVPWLHVRLDSSPKYYTYHGFVPEATAR